MADSWQVNLLPIRAADFVFETQIEGIGAVVKADTGRGCIEPADVFQNSIRPVIDTNRPDGMGAEGFLCNGIIELPEGVLIFFVTLHQLTEGIPKSAKVGKIKSHLRHFLS